MKDENRFDILDAQGSNPHEEEFIADVTENGVHLDHNWMDGALFIPHDAFEQLNDFREDIVGSGDQTVEEYTS